MGGAPTYQQEQYEAWRETSRWARLLSTPNTIYVLRKSILRYYTPSRNIF